MFNSSGAGSLNIESDGNRDAEPDRPGTMNPGATKAVATKLTMRPGMEEGFSKWQAAFTRVASGAPGFVSLEIIPAFPGSAEWQLIQRFRSPEALARWMGDEARAALLSALMDLDGSGQRLHADEAAPDYHSMTTVTEVFTTVVKPGQEEVFRRWVERIQRVQTRFPGYMGTLVQGPVSPDVSYWTTLVRFEAPTFLEAWLESPERKAILAEGTPFVSRWENHRMNNAFSGWFANEQQQAPPPAWKQTCLVLLVLFPVVMLEIRFLSPHLGGLPVAMSTFIGNALSVSVVSWPLMAVAIFCLGWWLRPAARQRWRTELLGISTIVGLYALELLIFTRVI